MELAKEPRRRGSVRSIRQREEGGEQGEHADLDGQHDRARLRAVDVCSDGCGSVVVGRAIVVGARSSRRSPGVDDLSFWLAPIDSRGDVLVVVFAWLGTVGARSRQLWHRENDTPEGTAATIERRVRHSDTPRDVEARQRPPPGRSEGRYLPPSNHGRAWLHGRSQRCARPNSHPNESIPSIRRPAFPRRHLRLTTRQPGPESVQTR
jgi:hypothetical protein